MFNCFIVECLRPASPRLYFSDRVEFVPDTVESKKQSFPTFFNPFYNLDTKHTQVQTDMASVKQLM